MSDALQRAGVPSMRFDYFGDGDSLGSGEEADLSIWQENIESARVELQRRSGCKNVSAVGIRVGAMILLDRLDGEQFDELIIIDPIVNGQSELDNWRLKHKGMLRDNYSYRFGRRQKPRQSEFEEIAGFCYGNNMLQQIASVSITSLPRIHCDTSTVVALGETKELLLLDCPRETAGDDPRWNDPVRAPDPIINGDLVRLVVSKLGAK